jgi:hypothetical protein
MEFENYVGAKIIKAKLSTLDKFKIEKYGQDATINEGDADIQCYIVIYPPIGADKKPYISMSPKEVFETVYRRIENSEISLIV